MKYVEMEVPELTEADVDDYIWWCENLGEDAL